MRRKVSILLLILAIAALLPGCRKTLQDPDSFEAFAQEGECVRGSDSTLSLCVSDAGVFYIDGGGEARTLCYYDYDSRSTFVMCSNPECRHSDADCPAFRGSDVDVAGFAFWGGSLWLLQKGLEDPTFQLFKMDVNCENQTVVAELPVEDGWQLSSISDVYYSGGFAWIDADYYTHDDIARKDKSASRLLAVRLADGEIIPLGDMLPSEIGYESFKAISDSTAAWRVSTYDTVLLSQEEYAEQYGSVDGYEDYCSSVLDDREITTSFWMASGENPEPRQISFPGDLIIGIWQGKCLGDSYGDGDTVTEILFDPDTGETRELLTVNGGALARYQGGAYNVIFDKDKFFFLEYQGEDKAQISCYSLTDDQITPLFLDDRGGTFRIIGETEDRLIGTIGQNLSKVWIWKSDYLNGDWSKKNTILSWYE